ncbi:PUA-like domain-containing protein [Podospora conica]|nr:PUA-like domain-containing protein [Schizothecium conicum]
MSAVDPQRPDIVAFMEKASAALGIKLAAPKDVFNFGGAARDDPVLVDKLLHLAIAGRKTATTSFPIPPAPLHWGVGDLSVILDGRGMPGAVMRTASLVQCKFKDVAVDFALAEAEGDYEAYRQGHIKFYRKESGHELTDESMVLCERFDVIFPKYG